MGKLSPGDIAALDRELGRCRETTGLAVVAVIASSPKGESVEDVAYETFNAWHIGDKGKGKGVSLLIAPAERKARIESGKGVGGPLRTRHFTRRRTFFFSGNSWRPRHDRSFD